MCVEVNYKLPNYHTQNRNMSGVFCFVLFLLLSFVCVCVVNYKLLLGTIQEYIRWFCIYVNVNYKLSYYRTQVVVYVKVNYKVSYYRTQVVLYMCVNVNYKVSYYRTQVVLYVLR